MLRPRAGFLIPAAIAAALSSLAVSPAAAQQSPIDCNRTVDDLVTDLFRRAGVGWDQRSGYRATKGPSGIDLPGAWAPKLEPCPSEAIVERLGKLTTLDSVITQLFGGQPFKWEARSEATRPRSIRVSIVRVFPRPDSAAGDDPCQLATNVFLTEMFRRLSMYWDDAKGWQATPIAIPAEARSVLAAWRNQCPDTVNAAHAAAIRSWNPAARDAPAALTDLAFNNPKIRWSVDNLGERGAPQIFLAKVAATSAPTQVAPPMAAPTPPSHPPADNQADEVRYRQLLEKIERIERMIQGIRPQPSDTFGFVWGILGWFGTLLAAFLGGAAVYLIAVRFDAFSLIVPTHDDVKAIKQVTDSLKPEVTSLKDQLRLLGDKLGKNDADLGARILRMEQVLASLQRTAVASPGIGHPQLPEGPRHAPVPAAFQPLESDLQQTWNSAIAAPQERDAFVRRFDGTFARLQADADGRMNLLETDSSDERRMANVLVVPILGHQELCYVLPSPYLQISDLAQHGFRFAREEFGNAYVLQASQNLSECRLEKIAIFRQDDAGEWRKLYQKGELRLPKLS